MNNWKLNFCPYSNDRFFLNFLLIKYNNFSNYRPAEEWIWFWYDIKNLSAGDGIIVCFDGGTAAHDLVDGVFIGAGESWYGRLPNTTVANLHAISADIGGTGDATANCIVAALIDDVA